MNTMEAVASNTSNTAFVEGLMKAAMEFSNTPKLRSYNTRLQKLLERKSAMKVKPDAPMGDSTSFFNDKNI